MKALIEQDFDYFIDRTVGKATCKLSRMKIL